MELKKRADQLSIINDCSRGKNAITQQLLDGLLTGADPATYLEQSLV